MKIKFPKLTTRQLLWLPVLAICAAPAHAVNLPDPAADLPLAATHSSQKAVLAGGCFWGLQTVFQHVKGVSHVTAGYAGGAAATAQYETVSTGTTGHAEAVEITYDPAQVSFGQLLKVYFTAATDPTELNRQGPDTGTQYRSEIFAENAEQTRVAQSYIVQLQNAKAFGKPIVTKVEPLQEFYPAEDYHQNYATLHPTDPYIAINDLPKVAVLQKTLPNLYAEPRS